MVAQLRPNLPELIMPGVGACLVGIGVRYRQRRTPPRDHILFCIVAVITTLGTEVGISPLSIALYVSGHQKN